LKPEGLITDDDSADVVTMLLYTVLLQHGNFEALRKLQNVNSDDGTDNIRKKQLSDKFLKC
jgi:hypothetical protein